MTDFCQMQLSCADQKEADRISNTLLVKHLVACVRQVPVSSQFNWQGKIERADEIMLLMESKMSLFEKVEEQVAKLHSYDTFVLEALPVNKVSTRASRWLDDEVS